MNCKYCNDYSQKLEPMTNRQDAESWLSFYENYMEVCDDRTAGNILTFKINYCPMCGKKLGN
jgi:hypothetical protein